MEVNRRGKIYAYIAIRGDCAAKAAGCRRDRTAVEIGRPASVAGRVIVEFPKVLFVHIQR